MSNKAVSMNDKNHGMGRKLTDYGDAEFSLYLRKAFIKAMGFTDDALSRPVIGTPACSRRATSAWPTPGPARRTRKR